MEFDRLEALRVGQELKKIRRQRGLSLAEVEALSDGKWKAVVIGSYERADRAISVGRLSALMGLYQAPMSAIFTLEPSRDEMDSRNLGGPIVFDLRKQAEIRKQMPSLAQLIAAIIGIRGDWNGHLLTLRANDLRLIAMSNALPYSELIEKLWLNQYLVQLR